jgi:ergothioneine biosynthesis protein EgtB
MTTVPIPADVPRQAATRDLAARYAAVRAATERLCATLEIEDFGAQSMPCASPVKWHLAHTSWFFETFVIAAADRAYRSADPRWGFLFNSYYNAVGDRIARGRRGLLTRPTVDEVSRYRRRVDEMVRALLDEAGDDRRSRLSPEVASVIELGLHHEQQHQELILTDLKHLFSLNPLRPVYRERPFEPAAQPVSLEWARFPSGLRWIGHEGAEFCYDNERPRHRVFLEAFQLGSRLVTNGEYLDFVEVGGYSRPEFWLSDGWDCCRAQDWRAPLYWEKQDGQWRVMTLAGMRPLDLAEPVCHVSYYEADAFARWSGARLPSEAEWEAAAAGRPVVGNLLECETFHPRPVTDPAGAPPLRQLFGDVWEWTRSPYTAYPGYRPTAGALGEYNGKFMCNQFVLRGGSCATPQSHIRATYRNFFAPDARWQFTGIRLADEL